MLFVFNTVTLFFFLYAQFCVVCQQNQSVGDEKCCVCNFGICKSHSSLVFLPKKFNLRDNYVHDIIPEPQKIPPSKADRYVINVICSKCDELVIAIRDEYFKSKKNNQMK